MAFSFWNTLKAQRHFYAYLGFWMLALGFPLWAQAVSISGASTLQPFIAEMAPEIEKQTGKPLGLRAGGSGAGIRDVLEGRSDLGMVSRALSTAEKERLHAVTLGFDALVLIVHADNPVSRLDKSNVVALYTGQTDNWRALGGPDWPVVRISKEMGRSTLELFEAYTGLVSPERPNSAGRPQISPKSHVIGANIEALMLVGGMSGAIAYVSFGAAQALQAQGLPIRILALDGVSPSETSIAQRQYPIVRELNLVYQETTPTLETVFAILHGPLGHAALKAQGFLPATR